MRMRRAVPRSGVTALLCLAPLLLANECENQNFVLKGVRILEPHENAVRTCKPFRVDLDFNEFGDGQSLEVLANGVDVSGEFSLGSGYNMRIPASAEWIWSDGAFGIGLNTLRATVQFPNFPMLRERTFEMAGDPYVDDVVSYAIGTQGGFNEAQLPDVVLGRPRGAKLFQGGLDVLSLGLGGSIDLVFQDNRVYDGPGDDLVVFENPFLTIDQGYSGPPFSEPGRVSVSQDGVVWYAFPCTLDPAEGPYYQGCAGVYPVLSDGGASSPHASIPTTSHAIEDLVDLPITSVPLPDGSGGDRFDLADVGLGWARYVRIEAADHVDGPAGSDNAAFDLDAVAAIHSVAASDPAQTSTPDCPVFP